MLMVMLGPLFGYVFFEGYSLHIRHNMELAMETGTLRTLSLPKEELQWTVENRELLIGGRFFDVKKVTVIANHITVVTGIFDDEETALNLQHDRQMNRERSQHQQNIAKLNFTFNSGPPCIKAYTAPVLVPKNTLRFQIFHPKLPAPYLPVSTPPPLA